MKERERRRHKEAVENCEFVCVCVCECVCVIDKEKRKRGADSGNGLGVVGRSLNPETWPKNSEGYLTELHHTALYW